MNVNVKLYNKCKYEKDSKVRADAHFVDVTSYEIREIPKDEILKETDESGVDDFNEYLILHFK